MTTPDRTEVIRASFPEDPAAGPALARVLLDQVAGGARGATVRISRPVPAFAFGRRDVVSPGYTAAVGVATEMGLPGIERISGGRATAYTDRTVVLGFTVPAREPARTTTERFEWVAGLVADTLGDLGAEALVGELEGEYCPGRFSVNLNGAIKVAGLGQRMIPGAAHVGVVLTVGGSRELRQMLSPVYRALGLDWNPGTAGSVSDRLPDVSVEGFEAALLGRLDRQTELVDQDLDPATMAAALEAAPAFRSPVAATSCGSGQGNGRGG